MKKIHLTTKKQIARLLADSKGTDDGLILGIAILSRTKRLGITKETYDKLLLRLTKLFINKNPHAKTENPCYYQKLVSEVFDSLVKNNTTEYRDIRNEILHGVRSKESNNCIDEIIHTYFITLISRRQCVN